MTVFSTWDSRACPPSSTNLRLYKFSVVFPSPSNGQRVCTVTATAADLWLCVQSPSLRQRALLSAPCFLSPASDNSDFQFPFRPLHYISPPIIVFTWPVASSGLCQNQWCQTSFALVSGSAPDAFAVILTHWHRSSTNYVDRQNKRSRLQSHQQV